MSGYEALNSRSSAMSPFDNMHKTYYSHLMKLCISLVYRYQDIASYLSKVNQFYYLPSRH